MDKITFEKATHQHQAAIFAWLAEPHIKEFWDNTQAHKDDILNFMDGRKQPSGYAGGKYIYWVGICDGNPYSLIMTIKLTASKNLAKIKNQHISKTGTTYGIDYMIGNKNYFGKGLGAKTLKLFIYFFHKQIDKDADTFLIDPDVTNPRAKHVYEKAGFKYVGDFIMKGTGVFSGRKTHLLVKKLQPS